MKRNTKILLILSLIILISISCLGFIALKTGGESHQEANLNEGENNPKIALLNDSQKPQIENNTNVIEAKQHEELINISECSEEFMEEYFEENKKINNKENVLIITSKEKIENTYGAVNVVEAPNHQYYMEYKTEDEKNQALKNFKNSNEVLYAEKNNEYTLFESNYNSWGIKTTSLDYAIEMTKGKELNDVTVAIIDSGCDMELFNKNYSGKIVENYNVLNPGGKMVDEWGHGTHIAGTIAEGTPANVKILPVKASTSKTMYNTDIIAGINYIVYNNKADVINMSFGGSPDSNMLVAINAANSANIICVAAAGNEHTSVNQYPAAYDSTISISSVDSSFNLSSFSSYGSTITFCAPGTDIVSINGTKSGTSMATPHAVCAVAILKSYNNTINLEDTINILRSVALDLGEEGKDDYYGYGLISFSNAVFCDKNGCDGSECDEFCILKQSGNSKPNIKIEIPKIIFTPYNFGSINNILGTKVNVYYNDIVYTTKQLWELEGSEIKGYDPYSKEEQTIEIIYKDKKYTFSLINPTWWEDYLGYEYTVLDETSIEITRRKDDTQTVGKIYIPEKLDGYNVVSIGEDILSAYSNDYKEFEEIILPKTVKKINKSFNNLSNLTKIISLADSIEIGEYEFADCKKLEIFDGVIAKLGSHAFDNCDLLNNITLSDTITEIPDYAFNKCENLKDINIPNSIKIIGKYAFCNTAITEIIIPKGVTEIKECSFAGCELLKKITLSEAVTKIEDYAFEATGITEIFIPRNVISIEKNVFGHKSVLCNIEVDENNSIYDSRDNCNAIIETATNTLVLGSGNTQIPETVDIIGENAFAYNLKLEEITIPEGVNEIQNYAFWGCDYLEEIKIPRSVVNIGTIGLENDITIWVYKDSYAKTYAEENELNYKCIDASSIRVSVKKTYKAFETVETDGMYILLVYDDGRSEFIREGIDIKYTGGNTSFRYGDTYFTVSAYSDTGEYIEQQVEVTVNKATPEYTIPTDIQATEGQTLSEVQLPSGFEWMDETKVIEGYGELTYTAKFIPEDTTNYETIENIEITIDVKCAEIGDVTVYVTKTEYKAFETVDTQGMYIVVTYESGRTEYIRDNIVVEYLGGNDSFRYGDTSFSVKAFNENGTLIASGVDVTVLKVEPEYTIPTNIIAKVGQKLAEIELPSGFTWMDNTQTIKNPGNATYYARYTPNDTTNYKTIENIEIIIDVEDVIPQSITLDKTNLLFNILEKQTLTATVMPANTTNKNVIWKATNTNVAQVNSLGEVQPINDGTCEIICVAEANQKVQARCTVVVDNTLQATINKTYNEDNTVTVEVVSKYPFEDTKPSWTLSEDRKIYEKIYNSNGTYSTAFVDVYGHTKTLTFTIDEIVSKYNVTKVYDANTNTVTVSVANNFGMLATKPSWTLSGDAKIYTKVYSANGTYTTTFTDAKGTATQLTFAVNEIDDVAPNLTTNMTYNEETNTVIVAVTSNEVLGETKPTWTLSADKKTYTKIYNTNGRYTTKFQDVSGNVTEWTFTVSGIISKYEITKTYDTTTNTVTVSVVNNSGMQQTKPSWTLSGDAKTYTKIYSANGTYTTTFTDAQGTATPLTFTVNEIDDVVPKLSIKMTYNKYINAVIVQVTSNEEFGETKPTWTLSEDKMTYSKMYNANGTYTTRFQDKWENEVELTFKVNEIQSKYIISKTYDSANNTVRVDVLNNYGMQATKPTWKLSIETTAYSKVYTANGTYTTTFVDADGVATALTFTIDEIK